LILFFTISILSTGISFKNSLEDNIKSLTPFDASISYRIENDSKIKSIDEVLNLLGFKFNSDAKIVSFNEYILSNSNLENLLKDNLENKRQAFYGAEVPAINISSYNNIRNLRGEKKINLADNQVLISSNTDEIKDALKKLIKNNSKIEINNKEYIVANNSLIGSERIINESLENDGFKLNTITLIVPDNVVYNLEPDANKIDINFTKNSNENQQKLNELFNVYKSSNQINDNNSLTINTRNHLIEENNGLSILVVFLGTYLGIIFLISSTAVLGLQQLSEASDSIDRYKSLRRIGVSQKMINKSIFAQVSIYFGLPLVVALIHSLVAIKVINKFLIMFNNVDILKSSLVTILIMVIIYGGYFYTTYTGYKSTVKNSLKIK
ncbi:TPA: ABC transporter permease, partial [Clostridium perfringens]|nr:ABC transporter permease [Clostridium perfringens]